MGRCSHTLMCLLLLPVLAWAQDKQDGESLDAAGNNKRILYTFDAKQKGEIYEVDYVIFDAAGRKICNNVRLTNDQKTGVVRLSYDAGGYRDLVFNISYKRGQCGLIISNKNFTDTTVRPGKLYESLVSFQDTSYTYPVLNMVKLGGHYYRLDRLTDHMVARHITLLAASVYKPGPEEQQINELKTIIEQDSAIIEELRARLNEDSIALAGLNDKKGHKKKTSSQ